MADRKDKPARFEILERRRAFQGFFALDDLTLRHERFGGGWSDPIRRELFCTRNAVGILPYDPKLDRVVLIEQFRTGALGSAASLAEARPWVVETAAGLMEPGEDPKITARRELVEECGIVAKRMELIHRFYPSPGASSEFVNLFVAEVDLTANEGGVHGLPSEHEDIMNHVLDLETAFGWLEDGRILGVTAVMALLWMKSEGAALRRRWL